MGLNWEGKTQMGTNRNGNDYEAEILELVCSQTQAPVQSWREGVRRRVPQHTIHRFFRFFDFIQCKSIVQY